MDKISRQRRQFLVYLGLGALGAGAVGLGARKITPVTIEPANSTPPETSLPEIPAKSEPIASASSENVLPDFQGIQQWLNSESLSVSNLKGKVVLIQFWTLGCINCQRTLPYITKWHQQYETQGLQVIGVHTPEFAFERDINNVKRALQQHRIRYSVAIDNEYKTWNAYRNQYWPHLFLADRRGVIRYDHIGEGAYDTTEQTIQSLLKEG